MTGTCSEKAGRISDALGDEKRTPLTSSDTIDSTQFSNAESDKKFGWMKRSMT